MWIESIGVIFGARYKRRFSGFSSRDGMGRVVDVLFQEYKIASETVSSISCIVSVALRFHFVSSVVSSVKSEGFQRTVMRSVPSLTWTKLTPGLGELFGGGRFGWEFCWTGIFVGGEG
jgi:hypothetical protein